MEIFQEILILTSVILGFESSSVVKFQRNSPFISKWYQGGRACYDVNGFITPCLSEPTFVSPRLDGTPLAYSCEPKDQGSICTKYLYFEKTKKVDFYTAKKECAAMGMQLVNIENRDKWGDVVVGIRSVGDGSFWTSALKDRNTHKFVWGNGCPLGFTNWDLNQPDNFLSRGEDCVQIRPNLKWNDIPCVGTKIQNMGYICESLECKH